MGAQPTKVQSTLQVLRGTPVEVFSKSEGRWIAAVIGGCKDVRDPPPSPDAVLVIFKEVVGGRMDAYKWIRCEDVPKLVRARPEAKRQAGMMDSMADTNFGTMFENRSAFEQRPTVPTRQAAPVGAVASVGSNTSNTGSFAVERQLSEQPAGVMASIMTSLSALGAGGSQAGSLPASAAGSFNMGRAPSMANGSAMESRNSNSSAFASMASTIDQNSSRLMRRPATSPMGHMAGTSIPEESAGITSGRRSQPPPNCMVSMVDTAAQPQGGVMQSIMGMGGNFMASNNGSMASCPSMVAYTENTSPNRTPMSSMNGKVQAAAPNPMSSFMSSMGFNAAPQQDARAGSMPAMVHRTR